MKNISRFLAFKVWAFISLAALLIGVPSATFALNTNSYVLSCPSCSTVAQFRSAGMAYAAQVTYPGVFVVSSVQYPKSGFVKVTGRHSMSCPGGDHNNCFPVLLNAVGTVITKTGATASDADLSPTDGWVFSRSRANQIPKLVINPSYSGSFINSLNEEVGPAVSQALVVLGYNPGSLPIGSIVLATFQDGTKAQYLKQCNCSDMWIWNGQAWDANGNRIKNDGSPAGNPNTSGAGGGSSSYSYGGGTALVSGTPLCEWGETMTVNGATQYIHKHLGPC